MGKITGDRWATDGRIPTSDPAPPFAFLCPITIALFGCTAVATAYLAQHALGMSPCPLCLLERWPYRVLILVGLAGFVLRGRYRRTGLWIAVLVTASSLALASLHFGVEQHWWPSPLPECNAPLLDMSNINALMASMPSKPSKPCDAANFLISGLPLSFVAMNWLYSLAGLGALLTYLSVSRKSPQSLREVTTKLALQNSLAARKT
jgi:disulfide bond formation protein DsbB